MTMESPSFILKQQKLKRSLFSLEMEQSLIFKEKKQSDDRKLSPWQERKNTHRNKFLSKGTTTNSTCEQFLKKVLFKKVAISKRVKTQNVQVTKKQQQPAELYPRIVLYPKTDRLDGQLKVKSIKAGRCLTGQNFSPSFREKALMKLEKKKSKEHKDEIFFKRLRKKFNNKNKQINSFKKSMSLKQMKDKLEKDSRKTTETFYLTNPETQSFLYSEKIKEKDEGKRGCLEWFIPRESRKRKGMSRMRGPWSTCRTVYIQ